LKPPWWQPIFRRKWKIFCSALLVWLFFSGWYHQVKPLPSGLNLNAWPQPAHDVRFFGDLTFTTPQGDRQSDQEIFDEIFAMISRSKRLILLDMFLFNGYLGSSGEPYRKLSSELTKALIHQKETHPEMRIIFITDPVNTIYGGKPEPHIEELKAAGIEVVITQLKPLRDSNPIYSAWYRTFFAPFGNSAGSMLPNPLGDGRVSIRSYLSLMNFKANHRKVIICDDDGTYRALVTSGNPHDASSAHDNVALSFSGPAVWDALQAELAVLAFSNGPELAFSGTMRPRASELEIRIVTEKAILDAVLSQVEALKQGEELDLMMFYLSHHAVVDALIGAHRRGAAIRVLLDPNKDAFGRKKNGIPNRQVALRLHRAGIPVRWADTHGEQCHSKMLLFRQHQRNTLILGSANLTRRNLDNYNLEMNVVLSGINSAEAFEDAAAYFLDAWSPERGKIASTQYTTYADPSKLNLFLYEVMERFGTSTF